DRENDHVGVAQRLSNFGILKPESDVARRRAVSAQVERRLDLEADLDERAVELAGKAEPGFIPLTKCQGVAQGDHLAKLRLGCRLDQTRFLLDGLGRGWLTRTDSAGRHKENEGEHDREFHTTNKITFTLFVPSNLPGPWPRFGFINRGS
ncbi:MAG: hypothetical protein LC732_10505, partial [Acidobacteria bacterium]|nr:hypothetical protein [Acidobacteriota bacterium]